MTKLFQEFKPADYDSWINQLKKDLKDKPLEALQSNPEKDLEIVAYHHPQKDQFQSAENSYANNFSRSNNNWNIRRIYTLGENKKILSDLNNGIDAIATSVDNQKEFSDITDGILFEHIKTDIRFTTKEAALNLQTAKHCSLNFDVISINNQNGKKHFDLNDFLQFYKKHTANKTIWISGSDYGQAGATTVQELAFSLAHLNEYVQKLHDEKIDLKEIAEKVILELSINENYFVNLAKFRAIRELTALLFSAYKNDTIFPTPVLYATTSNRFQAENDRNNNFLRQTTQAMSAILGGCDVITILPLTVKTTEEQELNERMAKNIPLVLREESYFDKVVDPAAGSMFIEDLTDQLVEKSWNLFKEIENKGGLISCIESNFIQNQIEENQNYLRSQIESKKQTFLGINKYPSSLEKWIDITASEKSSGADFKPLSPFKLEQQYQPKTMVS
ncbi:MAG: hypothetical protein IPM77_14565 [Crocinitomicaceae bacterium]|nr:hypothetical protein [Crocinitomicaceae bacterium]